MIYISTGGYNNISGSDVSKNYLYNGIENIELSSGLYSENLLENLLTLKDKVNFQIHNYFPPSESPFIFNLASFNAVVEKKSIDHAKKAIDWVSQLGGDTYSFHAGFLIDPGVNEIGKRIKKRKTNPRDKSLKRFIENVNQISDYADSRSVNLLIENNVISHNNVNEFIDDPFLMTEPEECKYVMNQTAKNVNLLVDVAHLKVSSNSLKYNPSKMFKLCEPWIKAYHLSDNDGLSDTNNSFSENTWFWKYLKKDCNYFSIEVYNAKINEIKSLIEITKNKISLN